MTGDTKQNHGGKNACWESKSMKNPLEIKYAGEEEQCCILQICNVFTLANYVKKYGFQV